MKNCELITLLQHHDPDTEVKIGAGAFTGEVYVDDIQGILTEENTDGETVIYIVRAE